MYRIVIAVVAVVVLLSGCADDPNPTEGELGSLPAGVDVSERSCANDGADCTRSFTFHGMPVEEVVEIANAAGYPIDLSLPLTPPRGCTAADPDHCAVLVSLAEMQHRLTLSGP